MKPKGFIFILHMEGFEMENQHKVPEIRQTVILNAPIRKVWEVVSSSEGIAAWFMPNDFQPEIGHAFTIQSPYGPSPCKVLELDPPYRLVFAWDTFGWRVTFELKDLGEQTEFTLIHHGWGAPDEIIPKVQETHAVIRERMNDGWKGIVQDRLRKYVES
jgi:uncharacterized protein YndB with AHSA1/START domain